MSIISQKILDELNEADRNKSKLSPSELSKFNDEYDSILKQIKDKKKKEAEEENDDDASFIPGPEPDDNSPDDGDEASHIPD